jgi:hypothetical protein
VVPQRVRRPEAGGVRHLVDRQVGLLQQVLDVLQPTLQQPL